jgi:nitrate reductase beta subunit
MKINELLEKNFTVEALQSFKTSYKKDKSRSALSQFLNADVENMKIKTIKYIANYFTSGDVNQLFALCNPKEVKSIVPQPKKLKI